MSRPRDGAAVDSARAVRRGVLVVPLVRLRGIGLGGALPMVLVLGLTGSPVGVRLLTSTSTGVLHGGSLLGGASDLRGVAGSVLRCGLRRHRLLRSAVLLAVLTCRPRAVRLVAGRGRRIGRRRLGMLGTARGSLAAPGGRRSIGRTAEGLASAVGLRGSRPGLRGGGLAVAAAHDRTLAGRGGGRRGRRGRGRQRAVGHQDRKSVV